MCHELPKKDEGWKGPRDKCKTTKQCEICWDLLAQTDRTCRNPARCDKLRLSINDDETRKKHAWGKAAARRAWNAWMPGGETAKLHNSQCLPHSSISSHRQQGRLRSCLIVQDFWVQILWVLTSSVVGLQKYLSKSISAAAWETTQQQPQKMTATAAMARPFQTLQDPSEF